MKPCISQISAPILHLRFEDHLHGRPAVDPRDLVPAKLLLAIGVANVGVDVVVVKDPAVDRIVVDALSTRSVDVVVRWEHNGATALLARFAGSIDLNVVSTFPTL